MKFLMIAFLLLSASLLGSSCAENVPDEQNNTQTQGTIVIWTKLFQESYKRGYSVLR